MPAPTPREVKHAADTTGSTTARTLTLTNAVSVGDRIYVIYTVNGFATGSFPLTENLGNTIGAAVAGSRPNSNSYAIHSYVVTNAGTPTFTVTKNGGATSTVVTITAIVIAAADDQGVDGTYKLVNGTSSGASVQCYVTLDSSSIATNYIVGAMFCTNTARVTPTLRTEANASYTDSGALNDIVSPWFESYRVVTGTTSALGVYNPGWTLNKANADEYFAVGFAIKGTSTDPTITGGTANPVHLSTGNTITGTNFGSNTGSAALTVGGQAQTVTGWTANTITYTANRGVNLDNVAVNAVVTNSTGTTSNSYALTGFAPPSGYYVVTLTSVNATAAYRITAIADLAIGNQIEWDNALVTVYADGSFVADPSVTTFNVRAGVTTDGWGALATQTIPADTPTTSTSSGGAGWGTPGDFPKRRKRDTIKELREEIEAVIARFDAKADVFHVELQQVAAQPVLFKAPAAPDFSPLFAQLSELTAQLQAVSARQAAEARAQVLAAQERAAQLEMQAAMAKAQQRKRRAVLIAVNYFWKD